MNPDCNILNPLQRDGTSQAMRLVRALHPDHVQVDEREIDDFLVYARDYARMIRYYSIENNPQGDWKVLIESDISVLISIIANTDLEPIRDAFKQGILLPDFFPPIIQLAKMADEWYANSIAGLPLHTFLEQIINSILNDALRNTISYALRAQEVGVAISPALINISSIRSDIWILDNIQPDPLLFSSGNTPDGLSQAVDRLRIEFRKVYDNLQAVISLAPEFLEETLEKYPEHEPHMALFLAFLGIFKIARNHLNTITRRHLNFYYREILALEPKAAQPDEVHIIFQLAKGFDTFPVAKNTDLNAGKDENKANLFYATGEELLVNKTQLDPEHGLKTIFIDKDYNNPSFGMPYTIRNIYAAPVANSADGLGANLEDEEGKWPTLGGKGNPFAGIGFAVASPMFLLGEGNRVVKIRFYLIKPLNLNYDDLIAEELRQNLQVLYTGKKAWVTALTDEVTITTYAPWPVGFIEFKITLPPEAEPVVAYNPEVIADGLNTKHPVFRFMLDNEGLVPKDKNGAIVTNNIKQSAVPFSPETSYNPGDVVSYQNDWYLNTSPATGVFPAQDANKWHRFEKSYPYKYFKPLSIFAIQITLDIDDVKNLILENDNGSINPAKPFNLFGPIPKFGSKFFIGNYEVFQKNVTALDLKMDWADLPSASFNSHYTKYVPSADIPQNDNEFTVDVEVLNGGTWSGNVTGKPLFVSNTNSAVAPAPDSPLSLNNVLSTRDLNPAPFSALTAELPRGFIRLKLNKNFLHKNFGPSVTTYVKTGSDNAPNEPYTPTLNSLTLDYEATEIINYNSLVFQDRVEQLFHFGPFGWQEFFPFDRGVDPASAVVSQKLVPEFLTPDPNDLSAQPALIDAEGSLYIGMSELEPDQTVSMLFQVAEGSANPDKAKQKVVWSFMANNRWHDFESNQILADSTNGLLTSGIVTFAMPRQMTRTNTLLPGGRHWIRGAVARDTDAISQTIAVMPQAVKATFRIQKENDLDRLKQALPAETIAKLRERQAAIKKVLQPFASFNGKVEEQVEAPTGIEGEDRFNKEYNEFYIRVSERLRHKNRGVAIFDYERLVLQRFPDIYKVKCLNHTCIGYPNHPVNYPDHQASEHAPGYVKLIVLPNLRNRNAVNALEPKVSLNRLEEIKNYLQPLISDFVVLEVKNPVFEKIQVEFNVRFFPFQEANRGFYENLLNQEIIQFLSPWLYQEGKDLQLGGKIHRSVILNFIEEREYVDFLTDFKLNHIVSDTLTIKDIEEAVAASSSSVLVSATNHIIGNDINVTCLSQTSS